MGCGPCECELMLPDQDPGHRFYSVLTATEDGVSVDFTGQSVSLVFDPEDDDVERSSISGTVAGTTVTFEGDQVWTAANLQPGTFYEVRLTIGTPPNVRRVGPVMGMNVTNPPKGVFA